MHTANVKQVLRVYSIEVAARERDDLKEDPIISRLRKVSDPFQILQHLHSFADTSGPTQAGGASYDGV